MRSLCNYMIFTWIIAVLVGCGMTGSGKLPEQGSGRAPLIDTYRIDVGDQLVQSAHVGDDAELRVG